jgi:hypothetical protein
VPPIREREEVCTHVEGKKVTKLESKKVRKLESKKVDRQRCTGAPYKRERLGVHARKAHKSQSSLSWKFQRAHSAQVAKFFVVEVSTRAKAHKSQSSLSWKFQRAQGSFVVELSTRPPPSPPRSLSPSLNGASPPRPAHTPTRHTLATATPTGAREGHQRRGRVAYARVRRPLYARSCVARGES